MVFDEKDTVYTLIFSLVSFLSIFPPHEIKSAGLTIEALFQGYFGDRNLHFILYEMRRIAMTKCIHSLLPTTYLFGLLLLQCSNQTEAMSYIVSVITLSNSSYLQLILVSLSLGLAVYVITTTIVWVYNDWALDPLAMTLASLSTRGSWREVAASVDTEVRRIDKFTSSIGTSIVYVTDTWLILVSMYKVDVVHQQDVNLQLCKAEEFVLSPESSTGTQFLEIEVTSQRDSDYSFKIRLNSFDYKDLKDKLRTPIENARNIVIHQSLSEKFIQAFQETVHANPRHQLPRNLNMEDIDSCIGCMQVQANVKLEKRCGEGMPQSQCGNCFCRPMWCVSCMARWFASRQEQSEPETWLAGSSPCPTCRTKFCLLDVSLIAEIS